MKNFNISNIPNYIKQKNPEQNFRSGFNYHVIWL